MTRLLRALVVALAVVACAAPLRAQISPGPLAKAHARLEGSTNCVQCHGLRKEPMSQMCLACHKEVAWLMQQNRGLHAASRNTAKKECASCHPDHAGVDFALVDWGPGGSAKFDHKRTGWALDGKHANAKCTACHTPGFQRSPSAKLSPRKAGPTWTGLESGCIDCHERDDVHRKSLGASCDKCHDAADWKKPTRFDHARSAYPLTGKHVEVACDKCHKAARLNLKPDADGRLIGIYKPLPSEECSACHVDPHKGRLSPKCSTCHNTRDFKEVDRKEFNHAATRYPLLGKHRAVGCEQCHGVNLSKKLPGFARCTDCHADAHFGRSTLLGQPADCAACHKVEGFTPSTYTLAQHATAAFKLTGRHVDVRCAFCHVPSDSVLRTTPRQVLKRAQLRPAAGTCKDCHVDAHNGELARSESKGTCTACHDDRGWSPTTFTVAHHARLKLPLDGAHQAVACSKCHVAVRPATSVAENARKIANTVSLAIADGCDGCHVDPHLGRYSAGGDKMLTDGCRGCHDARRFGPATLGAGRHAALGYPLDGAHRTVPCRECHKELGRPKAASSLKAVAANTVAPLTFDGPRRSACNACHADPHAGQFSARKGGGTCETCHEVAQWLGASRFVHDRDSSFPLAGAHSRVPCASCHVPVAQSGGGTRVQYRSLPTACEGCHTDATLRKRP